MTWAEKALSRLSAGEDSVLVTIASAQGSTPREAGTRMLIFASGAEGTIGGGRLEHKATALARQTLAASDPPFQIKRFSLGPELNQCCGGNVQLMLELITASAQSWLQRWAALTVAKEPWSLVTGFDGTMVTKTFYGPGQQVDDSLPAAVRQQLPRRAATLIRTDLVSATGEGVYYIEPNAMPASEIFLFGAGHVGKAIVRLFEGLPFRINWTDSREDAFPTAWPENVTRHVSLPPAIVDDAPPQAFYLVMTHSHSLDLEICARILRRDDFRFLGLIGSDTKRARFTSRLRAIGVPDGSLARLVCPIGVPGIRGKEPATIAVAVAAQLLMVRSAAMRRISEANSGLRAAANGNK